MPAMQVTDDRLTAFTLPPEGSTPRLLLEATIEALDSVGEGGLRISDLLESSGCSVSSLYHHFGNREGLVIAAQAERFMRSTEGQLEEFADRTEKATTPAEFERNVRAVIERLGSPASIKFRRQRLSALGSAMARQSLLEAMAAREQEIFDATAGILEGAKQRGLIRQDFNAVTYCKWFYGMVLGRVLSELGPTDDDVASWNEIAFEAAMAPIRVAPR